jgi:hypothetical protein
MGCDAMYSVRQEIVIFIVSFVGTSNLIRIYIFIRCSIIIKKGLIKSMND